MHRGRRGRLLSGSGRLLESICRRSSNSPFHVGCPLLRLLEPAPAKAGAVIQERATRTCLSFSPLRTSSTLGHASNGLFGVAHRSRRGQAFPRFRSAYSEIVCISPQPQGLTTGHPARIADLQENGIKSLRIAWKDFRVSFWALFLPTVKS